MSSGSVVAVSTGRAVSAAWAGKLRRFAQAGRPGAYLRVCQEGEVAAGDPVTVLDRPAERVTVAEAMRAYYGDAGLRRRLLTVPGLSSKWAEAAAEPAAPAAEVPG